MTRQVPVLCLIGVSFLDKRARLKASTPDLSIAQTDPPESWVFLREQA